MGQKKHIHIHICDVLNTELDQIESEISNKNNQIQAVTELIDNAILSSYKLYPTNYIAYDILNKTNTFESFYNESEKQLFQRRLEMKIDSNNPIAVEGFLNMYANPVVNKMKFE